MSSDRDPLSDLGIGRVAAHLALDEEARDDEEAENDEEAEGLRFATATAGRGVVGLIRAPLVDRRDADVVARFVAECGLEGEAIVYVELDDSHGCPSSRRRKWVATVDASAATTATKCRGRSGSGGFFPAPAAPTDMHDDQREFLSDLLATASPSGFETPAQRVWVEYVERFADDVRTDDYGNAIAVYDGGDGPEIAVGGHADEIGFVVSAINSDGYLHLAPVGGSDKSVSKARQVHVHTADGPVNGVIGQAAIHVRDRDDTEYDDIEEMTVDVGAADEAAARDLVDVGDPVTIAQSPSPLRGSLLTARGLDNRAGIWVAAETLRRAAERGAESTVYAVSTVQEEVGLSGAKMVGYDLDPDAAVAVDVTHASDHPEFPGDKHNEIALGDGPVVARGSTNHTAVVDAVRDTAADEGIDVQLQATGIRTGTDADAFYTARGGVPSLNLGLPNRYMHTPAEVVDTDDLDAAADLLASFAANAAGRESFAVEF